MVTSFLFITCMMLSNPAVFDFTDIRPSEGPWGTQVQLVGNNFHPRLVKIYYANAPITPQRVTSRVISVTIPENATTEWFEVEQAGRRIRAPKVFTVRNDVSIERSEPASGPADMWIRLHGRFFSEDTEFFLGRLKLNSTFISDKEVSVFLPAGVKSDFFHVTSFGKRIQTGVRYEVLPFPVVQSFAPGKAWVEDVVTVNGRHFCADALILIGGRPLVMNRITPTQLTGTVSEGIVSGQLTVQCFGKQFAAPNPLTIEPPFGSITAATPSAGAPGDWIELTGTGFTRRDQFWLGNAAITEVQFISDTQVRIRIPPNAVSDLFHHSSHRRIRPSNVSFTIAYPPVITQVLPPKAWHGDRIVLRGAHFCPDITVEVAGIPFPLAPVVSATEITAQVPPNARSGKITVQCRHWKVETVDFHLAPPPLVVQSAGPLAGPPGTEIIFQGMHFPQDARVHIGRMALTTRVFGPGRMAAAVPGRTAGPIRIFAYNQWWDTPFSFRIAFPAPEPQAFLPQTSWHLGTVTITGRNFCPKPLVTLNKVPLRVLEEGPDRIMVQLPPRATPGEFFVECHKQRVPVPGKLSLRPPVGNISSIFPLAGPVGTVLTVRGSQLKPDSEFTIGRTRLPSTFVNESEIQLRIPEGIESGRIVLSVPQGRRRPPLRVETDFSFTLAYPEPAITSVSPDLGWHQDKITIDGRQFCAQAAVFFPGNIQARILARHSHTRLIVEVPTGAASGQITVRCPGVEGKSGQHFTVAPPYARISAVSAQGGCGGDEVTFTGVNFDDKTRIHLGDSVLGLRIISATQAVGIIPADARSGDFHVESYGQKLPTRFSYIIRSRLCRERRHKR